MSSCLTSAERELRLYLALLLANARVHKQQAFAAMAELREAVADYGYERGYLPVAVYVTAGLRSMTVILQHDDYLTEESITI